MPKVKKEIKENKETKEVKGKKEKKATLAQRQMADGKLYNKHGVKSIDELLGLSAGKYNTHDLQKYEDYLAGLNTSDLQAHATRVGVMPNQDRNILLKRLVKEFRVSNSGYINTAKTGTQFSKPISKRTLDILGEGR